MREGYPSESEEEAKRKIRLHQNISELYRFLTERTRKSRKPPDVSSPKKKEERFLLLALNIQGYQSRINKNIRGTRNAQENNNNNRSLVKIPNRYKIPLQGFRKPLKKKYKKKTIKSSSLTRCHKILTRKRTRRSIKAKKKTYSSSLESGKMIQGLAGRTSSKLLKHITTATIVEAKAPRYRRRRAPRSVDGQGTRKARAKREQSGNHDATTDAPTLP
jgi:transcriptional regulator of met regulon